MISEILDFMTCRLLSMRIVIVALLQLHIQSRGLAEQRGVTPGDCVGIRYFAEEGLAGTYGSISLSEDGSYVAYIVRSPNLNENRDEHELFIHPTSATRPSDGKVLLSADDMSHIEWFGNSHVMALIRRGGVSSVVIVDILSGDVETVVQRPNILEYSSDRDGRTIVFSTPDISQNEELHPKASNDRESDGYPIIAPTSSSGVLPHRALFIIRRSSARPGDQTQRLMMRDPFSAADMSSLAVISGNYLSLSPDGTKLLFQYIPEHLPSKWIEHPYAKFLLSVGASPAIMGLYDLNSRGTTVPLDTIAPSTVPVWDRSSSSFMVVAPSPFNSAWEREDVDNGKIGDSASRLFWVEPQSGRVEQVWDHVANHHEKPSMVGRDNVLVHTGGNSFIEFQHSDHKWITRRRLVIPLKNFYPYSLSSSNEELIVGAYEATLQPPELFRYSMVDSSVQVLTKLNSIADTMTLAPVEPVQWQVNGEEIDGLLFRPINYDPRQKYPLVIQATGNQGSFMCDSGFNHEPSFAPQPIANAGIFYLVRRYPDSWTRDEEIKHYPRGYPGQLSEAAFQMELWDSAVQMLSTRGVIDPARVGIIGFSRTGWYTEFTLAHSHIHYLAASVTDNVEYNLGEYWLSLSQATMRGFDEMYGGPPYGATLKNWMEYSTSFNLDRIHTPLLMAQFGYSVYDDSPGKVPFGLADSYETFIGLLRVGTPVELYYYPNEVHEPEHPRARLAMLERNVDWFRFWLQGYEESDPAKRPQYQRWENLRELRNADEKNAVQMQSNKAKPN